MEINTPRTAESQAPWINALAIVEQRLSITNPIPSKKRLARGTDGKRDGIWTRHHAFCAMAVIGDEFLGGREQGRQFAGPPKLAPALKTVPAILLEICPWILNERYLNLEGSSGLMQVGLRKMFDQWAANRVYYFYRGPGRNEHPANRRRGNLRAVYDQFYDLFHLDIIARTLITEERADAFWQSVADVCPYLAPSPDHPLPDVGNPATVAPDIEVANSKEVGQ